jgi:hypothetical protein
MRLRPRPMTAAMLLWWQGLSRRKRIGVVVLLIVIFGWSCLGGFGPGTRS